MSADQRCTLVDMNDKVVSISKQCRMLDLSRSRLYYVPTGIAQEELRAMQLKSRLVNLDDLDPAFIQKPNCIIL